ncbi:cupin domain-containing protein [Chlorobaculum sp. 24CR]|uniref:cupin domain-containing protein n=1 Tax=Chlorobaculum sp. 24CR TaxID=2508878 RepID=UPI00100AC581|nr:cupin domain-containing protein [Chlorobaculum sp. 24CR]RXK80658.1 cupin domain-containing protein [Chlorobaculum sp. 24CR]
MMHPDSGAKAKKKRQSRFLFLPILWMALLTVCPASTFARDYAQAKVETLEVTSTNYAGQPLSYPEGEMPEVTALIVHMPPGSSTGWHKHPVPVYAWMIEGELTVKTENGVEKKFVKGEPIIEVLNLMHNGTNTGKETASLVVFYAGFKGVPNVIKADSPKP